MINKIVWQDLTPAEQLSILERPSAKVCQSFHKQIHDILNDVKTLRDDAIARYTRKYDQVILQDFKVTEQEITAAKKNIKKEDAQAIKFAFKQIYKFHSAQYQPRKTNRISNGIVCLRQARPIEKVGLYVPGGAVPLPSTLLMLGVPALIARCPTRIVCTPPKLDGSIDPNILFAADLCGIPNIYKIGGVQAIAAMAYGTQSVPKVQKIFGPGNCWVNAAKIAVMRDPQGTQCDLPAGPSELLIIADSNANPEFIAADLLSQAEHGIDAQVFLITDSNVLADQVSKNIALQLQYLPRENIIMRSLQFGKIILVDNLETAFSISNCYAPEHLSLQIVKPRRWLNSIKNAGAVFLGGWTAQTLGDYVIGTNHVLPTDGYSKVCSGLCVKDFYKVMNIAQITRGGYKKVAPFAVKLAQLEQLEAHANAMTIRLRAML